MYLIVKSFKIPKKVYLVIGKTISIFFQTNVKKTKSFEKKKTKAYHKSLKLVKKNKNNEQEDYLIYADIYDVTLQDEDMTSDDEHDSSNFERRNKPKLANAWIYFKTGNNERRLKVSNM